MIDKSLQEEVRALRGEGMSINAIAKAVQISRPSVYKILGDHLDDDPESIEQRPDRHRHHPFSDQKREVIPVSNPSQRVVAKREDTEMTELELRKQKAVRELENVTGSKEHPALQEKRARVEVAKLSVEEFEAQKKLEALKKEELRKAQAEREAHLQRIEEAERSREEEERIAEEQVKRKKHQEWIEDRKNYAVNCCLPFGVNIPPSVRFQIKDKVGEVLTNRSENEYGIYDLIRETVKAVLQPYLDEQEVKREAEELRCKGEEVKRKRAKKIELINRALGEVDDYIKRNRLDPYVNEEAKKKIREQIYNHLLETLPDDIRFVPDSQVREILDSALKDTNEKAREVERKAYLDKIKEIKIKDLLQVGMNRLSYYLLINSKDLETVTPKERDEAKRFLEKALREEIEGDETFQEVEKIANQILDDFFFEES